MLQLRGVITTYSLLSRRPFSTAIVKLSSRLVGTMSANVNLLDMAASILASSVSASLSIRAFAEPTDVSDDQKNARVKPDGSFVTDADFAAQSIITKAVQRTSDKVRILGEEDPEGMAQIAAEKMIHPSDSRVYELSRKELYLRYRNKSRDSGGNLPLAAGPLTSASAKQLASELEPLSSEEEQEIVIDASRVTVIIDPLDGTKSYAKGEYDAVSILIAINLDEQPHFGVICKPFGYNGLTPILNTQCAAVYGGPLLRGAFNAGGSSLAIDTSKSEGSGNLPRAIISSSRSAGVVEHVCKHLGSIGIIHPEPMHISGAGEKSLRLILRHNNEGVWFFPKSGTSLWDIAASDALLRSLGGKVTDKYGRALDYTKSRTEAENLDGIIACSDDKIHAEVIRVFQEGHWDG